MSETKELKVTLPQEELANVDRLRKLMAFDSNDLAIVSAVNISRYILEERRNGSRFQMRKANGELLELNLVPRNGRR